MNLTVGEPRIQFDRSKLLAFCEKWKVKRFEFFGSVLREDFGPESDVDCMVTFENGDDREPFDLIDMQFELEAMFGHPAEVVTREQIEESDNPFRRPSILNGARDVVVR
jgi:predicted nucleotidyltransferase